MFKEWKKHWKVLDEAPAGRRFLHRHATRQRESRSRWKRAVTIVIGLALIAAGAIMLVIPGPGLLANAFGCALIAQEFRWAAVALDWIEVTLRKAARRASRFWKSASAS